MSFSGYLKKAFDPLTPFAEVKKMAALNDDWKYWTGTSAPNLFSAQECPPYQPAFRPLPDPKTLRDERGDRYASITVPYRTLEVSSPELAGTLIDIERQLHRMGVRGKISMRDDSIGRSVTYWGRIDPMCEPVNEEKRAINSTGKEKKTAGRYIKLEEER